MKKLRAPICAPKLRFPEFRDATEWAQKVGEDLFLNRKEIGEDGLPIYSVTINDGMVPRASFDRDFYDIADSAGNKKVREGDIAYNMMRMWQGALGVAPTDCMVSPAYVVLAPKEGTCTAFFAQFFKLPQSLELLTATSRGLTKDRLRLYFDDFARMRLCAPEYDEQKRIAACLASLDELSVATSQKLDALKAYKKGLMQQLFPREGETVPRLRFPEFHEAPEWGERRVGELGDVLAGKALAVNAPSPQRPYLRTKNVLDGAIDLSDVRTMPMTDAEFSRFEIFNGDVLLNEGQSLELVGRASIYRGEFGGRCAIQNQLLRFRAFPSTSPEFAAQVFRQCQQDGTFTEIATKTTSIAHLGSSRFSALALPWPSPAEQHRIATCLSSLDELIAAQSDKLEVLSVHKKGLMQQLFPSPAEAVE